MSDQPYYLLESAISEEERLMLLDYFDETRQTDDPRHGYTYSGLREIVEYAKGEVEASGLDPRIQSLARIVDKSSEYFTSTFEMDNVFEYKRGFLNSMEGGAELGEHSDDDDLYEGRRKSEKHYSGLLFLSDEYEGGELTFPEFGVKIKPNSGDLILFRGKHKHGVRPVTSGIRVNYVIFFKDYDPNEEVLIQEFHPSTYDTGHGAGTHTSQESI
jgi:hypothetical protein